MRYLAVMMPFDDHWADWVTLHPPLEFYWVVFSACFIVPYGAKLSYGHNCVQNGPKKLTFPPNLSIVHKYGRLIHTL